MNNDSGRGFTIVELLIVIVVIAVLATIVIIAYNGITNQAYQNRASQELGAITKAIQLFETNNGRYPVDVQRGIPAEITPYLNGSAENWPDGPWPSSVYDYDYFTGSDGRPVVQMSVRFCPLNADISQCRFPSESWAAGFGVDSSAYWCLSGVCRAHASQPDTYPGYCINCRET